MQRCFYKNQLNRFTYYYCVVFDSKEEIASEAKKALHKIEQTEENAHLDNGEVAMETEETKNKRLMPSFSDMVAYIQQRVGMELITF